MTTQDVADLLVKSLRAGDYDTIYKDLFSPDIISAEPEGAPWGVAHGLEELAKRGEQFQEMVEEIHSSEISDPIVAENFIALTMKMKTTFKGSTEIANMDEVCVYEVKEGKIVKEQFFFPNPPAQ